jgi:hypothetical protein
MSHIILPNLEKLLLRFYLEPESHLPDVTIVIPTLHWFSDSEMLEESAPMTHPTLVKKTCSRGHATSWLTPNFALAHSLSLSSGTSSIDLIAPNCRLVTNHIHRSTTVQEQNEQLGVKFH